MKHRLLLFVNLQVLFLTLPSFGDDVAETIRRLQKEEELKFEREFRALQQRVDMMNREADRKAKAELDAWQRGAPIPGRSSSTRVTEPRTLPRTSRGYEERRFVPAPSIEPLSIVGEWMPLHPGTVTVDGNHVPQSADAYKFLRDGSIEFRIPYTIEVNSWVTSSTKDVESSALRAKERAKTLREELSAFLTSEETKIQKFEDRSVRELATQLLQEAHSSRAAQIEAHVKSSEVAHQSRVAFINQWKKEALEKPEAQRDQHRAVRRNADSQWKADKKTQFAISDNYRSLDPLLDYQKSLSDWAKSRRKVHEEWYQKVHERLVVEERKTELSQGAGKDSAIPAVALPQVRSALVEMNQKERERRTQHLNDLEALLSEIREERMQHPDKERERLLLHQIRTPNEDQKLEEAAERARKRWAERDREIESLVENEAKRREGVRLLAAKAIEFQTDFRNLADDALARREALLNWSHDFGAKIEAAREALGLWHAEQEASLATNAYQKIRALATESLKEEFTKRTERLDVLSVRLASEAKRRQTRSTDASLDSLVEQFLGGAPADEVASRVRDRDKLEVEAATTQTNDLESLLKSHLAAENSYFGVEEIARREAMRYPLRRPLPAGCDAFEVHEEVTDSYTLHLKAEEGGASVHLASSPTPWTVLACLGKSIAFVAGPTSWTKSVQDKCSSESNLAMEAVGNGEGGTRAVAILSQDHLVFAYTPLSGLNISDIASDTEKKAFLFWLKDKGTAVTGFRLMVDANGSNLDVIEWKAPPSKVAGK